MLTVGIGFALYMALKRTVGAPDGVLAGANHLGAASLVLHSVMDGAAVGLASKISPANAVVVAVAVLAHDVADGVNTVNLSYTAGGERRHRAARLWLLADAAAPLIGIAASRTVSVPGRTLGSILSVFAGVFFYIGAAELLPLSQLRGSRLWVTGTVIAGLIALYLVASAGR